ncbi:MAG TPA: hypothetical protein VEI01_05085 [Terriglobales bacterium]|nr:hypothetical protein [Terriglobales bacterium]
MSAARQEGIRSISAIDWAGSWASFRRRLLRQAQEIAYRQDTPWLGLEQEEAEKEYLRVARRFVEMGNDFLNKLAEAGIPELAQMPHGLDPETHSFQVHLPRFRRSCTTLLSAWMGRRSCSRLLC